MKVVGVTQMPRICRSAPLSSVGLNHSLLNRPPDAFAHAPALSGSTIPWGRVPRKGTRPHPKSLWGSSATTPLVDFRHRLTACPSYNKTPRLISPGVSFVVKVVGVTQMPRICRSAPLPSVGLNHSLLNRPPDAFPNAPALSGSTPSVYIT